MSKSCQAEALKDLQAHLNAKDHNRLMAQALAQ